MEVRPVTQPKITVAIRFKRPAGLRRAVYDVDSVTTYDGPVSLGQPLLLLKLHHPSEWLAFDEVVASFKLELIEKFSVRDYTKKEIR